MNLERATLLLPPTPPAQRMAENAAIVETVAHVLVSTTNNQRHLFRRVPLFTVDEQGTEMSRMHGKICFYDGANADKRMCRPARRANNDDRQKTAYEYCQGIADILNTRVSRHLRRL